MNKKHTLGVNMYMPAGAQWAQDRIWDEEEREGKESSAKALIRKFAIEEAYGEAIEKIYFKQKRSWKEAEKTGRDWAENVKIGFSDLEDEFSYYYDLTETDYYAILGDKVMVDECLENSGVYDDRLQSEYEDASYHEPDEAFWGGC
jgi:hypothetical protein